MSTDPFVNLPHLRGKVTPKFSQHGINAHATKGAQRIGVSPTQSARHRERLFWAIGMRQKTYGCSPVGL
jgi:hypothetical protein